MCELVDHQDLGVTSQSCVQIELVAHDATVADGERRQARQPFQQPLGLDAAVRLHVADDQVGAGGVDAACRLEHCVGLADTGGSAEEDFQPAAARARLVFLDLLEQLIGVRPGFGHVAFISARRAPGSAPVR